MGTTNIRTAKGRKWQITINNYEDKNYDFETLRYLIDGEFPKTLYYCYSAEIGKENGTPHLHIFIALKAPTTGGKILSVFDGCHLEKANGTCISNKNYIYKIGKWVRDKKADTRIEGMQYESCICPTTMQGDRVDLSILKDLVVDGKTNAEIFNLDAYYIKFINHIEKLRQDLLMDKYKNEWRNLEVTYISGGSGIGKTRGVMEKYGYENVYRVTDYQHPFDSYKGQDIIVFEEFRSDLKISDMLNYLDGYPLELPCRYVNRIACFTKVYIISNWDIEEQYQEVQKKHPSTWKAFLRRINKIKIYGEEVMDYVQVEAKYFFDSHPYEWEYMYEDDTKEVYYFYSFMDKDLFVFKGNDGSYTKMLFGYSEKEQPVEEEKIA